jgi:hypothetical protein
MLCFVAAAWLLRMPRPPLRGSLEKARPATLGQRRQLALLGGVVTTVTGAVIGLINLAGPLVLVRLGAAERTSGVVFVIAAVATMIIARPLGITVDRWGATGPQQRGCS